jgi:Helix-turn-helix domain
MAYAHREKMFGEGRPTPLDRNEKCRLWHRAKACKRAGTITGKAFDVYETLLWMYHNARSGLCFPSYETIAEVAGCAVSTVGLAIKQLEACKLLTWVNRLKRIHIPSPVADLLGDDAVEQKVVRTSNSYAFPWTGSETENRSGHLNPKNDSMSVSLRGRLPTTDRSLMDSLASLGEMVARRERG